MAQLVEKKETINKTAENRSLPICKISSPPSQTHLTQRPQTPLETQ